MERGRKRIRKLERIESAVMCVGAVFFLTMFLAASGIDSGTSWQWYLLIISIAGGGLCTYIGNRINDLIRDEIDRI